MVQRQGIIERLIACRECSVPIVGITSPDEWAAAANVSTAFAESPLVRWTYTDGLVGINADGQEAVAKCGDLGGYDKHPTMLADAVTVALMAALKLPEKSLLLMVGAHRFCGMVGPEEAMKKLRDQFKQNERMLVLLGPSFSYGQDIAPHMEMIEEPRPDEVEREVILNRLYTAAEATKPDAESHNLAIGMTRGLCAFAVEQAGSLAMRPDGIDLPELRQRWRDKINTTVGLSLDDTVRDMASLGGLTAIKEYATLLKGARTPPSAVILMDEGGKVFAGMGANGGGGDTSGVSQGLEALLLGEMDQTKADGIIAYGVQGAGKTASAQAIAAALGVPIIRFDVNGFKGSLVGQSEQNMRTAFSVLRALVGDRAFWIMTSNELVTLDAAIRRRFKAGQWFYDLPNDAELTTIIGIYSTKHGIPYDESVDMTGWTGAEVETCFERAYNLRVTLAQSAKWIVPVSVMAADSIEQMRSAAVGRFLAASHNGKYRHPKDMETTSFAPSQRRVLGRKATI